VPPPPRPVPTTTASMSALIIDVANYDASFPGIKMRSIIMSSLARWRIGTMTTGGDTNFASDKLTSLLRAIDNGKNVVRRKLADLMLSLPPPPPYLLIPTSENCTNDHKDKDERNIKEQLHSLTSSTDLTNNNQPLMGTRAKRGEGRKRRWMGSNERRRTCTVVGGEEHALPPHCMQLHEKCCAASHAIVAMYATLYAIASVVLHCLPPPPSLCLQSPERPCASVNVQPRA
jgi:hypothetical protein